MENMPMDPSQSWETLLRDHLPPSAILRCQAAVQRFRAASAGSPVPAAWQAYAASPDVSWAGLTAALEARAPAVTWQELHNFRFDLLTALTSELLGDWGSARVVGSQRRAAGIRITVGRQPVRAALVLAFAFGLAGRWLLNLPELPNTVDAVLRDFATVFSPCAGLVLSTRSRGTPSCSTSCCPHTGLFLALTSVLLQRLRTARARMTGSNTPHLARLARRVAAKIAAGPETTRRLRRQLTDARASAVRDPSERFRRQIEAAERAERASRDHHACGPAARCEASRVLANAASPGGGGWATPTLALAAGQTAELTAADLWLALLENLALAAEPGSDAGKYAARARLAANGLRPGLTASTGDVAAHLAKLAPPLIASDKLP